MEIKYPKDYSEAEIQALLWDKLKKEGIDARLQVQVNGQPEHKIRTCRLDLVVFKGEEPACIVECKAWVPSAMSEQQSSRQETQVKKYESYFKIPVLVCSNYMAIPRVIQKIKEIYE